MGEIEKVQVGLDGFNRHMYTKPHRVDILPEPDYVFEAEDFPHLAQAQAGDRRLASPRPGRGRAALPA